MNLSKKSLYYTSNCLVRSLSIASTAFCGHTYQLHPKKLHFSCTCIWMLAAYNRLLSAPWISCSRLKWFVITGFVHSTWLHFPIVLSHSYTKPTISPICTHAHTCIVAFAPPHAQYYYSFAYCVFILRNLEYAHACHWVYRNRVLSRNFGLGWKEEWHFHAQSPPPNH